MEKEPDVVALELDERRLQALLSDAQQSETPRNPFFILLKTIQDVLGKRTGAIPGSDMLEAFNTAVAHGVDVALIDQDITVTLQELKAVPLLEKIKFFGFMAVGVLVFPTQQFNLRDVPEQDLIHKLLLQFQVSFPHMYDALVDDRNRIMAEKLQALDEEYEHVLAFVGAGHVEGIRGLLDGDT